MRGFLWSIFIERKEHFEDNIKDTGQPEILDYYQEINF